MRTFIVVGSLLLLLQSRVEAALGGPPIYLLPIACSELLPDTDPFLKFLDSVARGNLVADPKMSKRVFRMLALREKVADVMRAGSRRNPVDVLVQKTLCFYRQQKEPIKPVPYDDADFLVFLKGSFDDLEKQVNSAIQQDQLERLQKQDFERKLEQNREREEELRRQAQRDADRELKQITDAAKKQFKKGS